MSEYLPSRNEKEDLQRQITAEHAQKLGNEILAILGSNGSEESLELAEELVLKMGSLTRKALTGTGGDAPITEQEMRQETRRWLENGRNPYPLLTMEESEELTRYLDHGTHSAEQHTRNSYLQRKACGMI